MPGIRAFSASFPAISLRLLGAVVRMLVVFVWESFRHGPVLERIQEHNQGTVLLSKHIKPCTSFFGESRMTACAAFFVHHFCRSMNNCLRWVLRPVNGYPQFPCNLLGGLVRMLLSSVLRLPGRQALHSSQSDAGSIDAPSRGIKFPICKES